ncbi:hypothetical protein ACFOVU_03200 [Nocardiopsis sediminis]|uniref:Uncharacterized protein n=1 Tax=Nocardiopsis sediminis TaxID=1778267 RepID=A0ABV8FHV2_9ACTN
MPPRPSWRGGRASSAGYLQIPLWLSRDELSELVAEMRAVIASRMDNEPAPDRRLHLLSPILFPIEERPGADSG